MGAGNLSLRGGPPHRLFVANNLRETITLPVSAAGVKPNPARFQAGRLPSAISLLLFLFSVPTATRLGCSVACASRLPRRAAQYV